jgi:hypothetical protein
MNGVTDARRLGGKESELIDRSDGDGSGVVGRFTGTGTGKGDSSRQTEEQSEEK